MPSKIGLGAIVAAVVFVGAATAMWASAAPPEDACALLAPAQVGAALGTPVGAGSYVTPTFKKTCTWHSKGPAYVTLMLQNPDAFQAGKSMGAVRSITITPAAGIGDDAYYLAVGDNVGLIVKKGAAAFKAAAYIHVPMEKKRAIEKALAQQVVAKL